MPSRGEVVETLGAGRYTAEVYKVLNSYNPRDEYAHSTIFLLKSLKGYFLADGNAPIELLNLTESPWGLAAQVAAHYQDRIHWLAVIQESNDSSKLATINPYEWDDEKHLKRWLGIVYMLETDIANIGSMTYSKILSQLVGEVHEYSAFLTGDVYSYSISDENGMNCYDGSTYYGDYEVCSQDALDTMGEYIDGDEYKAEKEHLLRS